MVSSEAILLSIVEQANLPADTGTVEWMRRSLLDVTKIALENASGGAISRSMASIKKQIAAYQSNIGEVCQQLPGEEQTVDPMLIPKSSSVAESERRSTAGQESKSPVEPPGEKRKLLKQLLSDRIAAPNNDKNP